MRSHSNALFVLLLSILFSIPIDNLGQSSVFYSWIEDAQTEISKERLSKACLNAIRFEIDKNLARRVIYQAPDPQLLLQLGSTVRVIHQSFPNTDDEFVSPWKPSIKEEVFEGRKLYLNLVESSKNKVFKQIEVSFLAELNESISDQKRARIVKRMMKKFPSKEELQNYFDQTNTITLK